MKILAFLQNPWVKDPDRVKKMIAEGGERFRRRFVAFALFNGCLTGNRLKKAFGNLCQEIVWEECSLQIGGHAASSFPADLDHMLNRITEEQPDLVLAFGATARSALLEYDGKILCAPHPAARFPDIQDQLNAMAYKTRKLKI